VMDKGKLGLLIRIPLENPGISVLLLKMQVGGRRCCVVPLQRYVNECCESESDGNIDGFGDFFYFLFFFFIH
jgi:hypothetical protein